MLTDLRSQLSSLQWQLEERNNPGDLVEITLGIPKVLDAESLALFKEVCTGNGLVLEGKVEIYSPKVEWPSAFRLTLRRPRRGQGPLDLAAVLGRALTAAGLDGILGWEIRG